MSEVVSESPESESLKQIGAELRQRREQVGYSLSEVADAIRINQEVLNSIESGQIDYSPGQAFIRGFMRSYARFLDMDMQVLQDRLNAIMGEESRTVPYPIQPVQGIKTTSRSRSRWIWLVAVVIVGAAVAWYVVEYQLGAPTSEAAAVAEPETEAAPTPEVLEPQVTETTGATSEEQASSAPETTEDSEAGEVEEAEETALVPEAEQTKETTTTPQVAEETVTGAVAEEAVAASIAGAQAALPGLQLTVDAHERVWISLEIDGKIGVDVLLEEGDTYEWEADERYLLTVGNVHSVEVRLNGKPLVLDPSQDLLLNRVLDASLLN